MVDSLFRTGEDTILAGIRRNRLTAHFNEEQAAQLEADIRYYLDIAGRVQEEEGKQREAHRAEGRADIDHRKITGRWPWEDYSSSRSY